jgi:hypothetical protein
VEPNRPFRWDIAGGAKIGTLIDDIGSVDLWYLDELVDRAAKVLARSADGDLRFVGRSVDSLYDLLSGALAGTSWAARLQPLPLSYSDAGRLDDRQVAQLRANLTADGLAPYDLARRRGPAVFVDLVWEARTLTNLYTFLRSWVDDERASVGCHPAQAALHRDRQPPNVEPEHLALAPAGRMDAGTAGIRGRERLDRA